MDDNKKNPFDDFFQSNKNDKSSERHEEGQDDLDSTHTGEPAGSSQSKTSYYYSYGPFKPNGIEEQPNQNNDQGNELMSSGGDNQVEMTPPQQQRSFAPTQPARNGWQVKEPRRTSFKAMFASFMVGVLVVGALMFAADTQNWFTANQVLSPQPSSQATTTAGSSGDNGTVSTAADVVRPNNIAQIFQKASPAVVKIETFVNQQANSYQGDGIMNDPFFRQFFGDQNGGQDNGQGQDNGSSGTGQLTPEGMGTGFFFDSNGYILTNEHVVDGADQIQVTVQGYKKPFIAKKLGSDYNLDLAVLKVEGTNFPTLPIGSSDKIDIGDWVVAIGNPYGFDHTVTVGVLSAKERPISIPDTNGTRNYQHLLQTDASINPGNSGGPLLNLEGQVVGINTAVSSQAQGIGFAIPSSTILENLANLKSNKEIPKTPVPFIGADLAPITDQIAKQLGLSSTDGSIVSNVYYKSPAYMADLRQYDVITGLDGTKYKTSDELVTAIQKKKVGDSATLNIIRDGKAMNLNVVIGDKNKFDFTNQ
ncbi:trypsin-like peptidase domain-containing protein [Paenibacillus sp. sptzw28]|uniref:S1C family serine protease n=1 Tax=Paenibacillus sp. sptzw28 TaxID=715179 RepID=UPI001C6F108A|nr:trypsin-like peptidase domain-containing protein [Paenibacillus sp. sptzw28]QYR20466.1 trypsin-like peptidase domain-containing protein [Paenibacillus sp. sptzw28]